MVNFYLLAGQENLRLTILVFSSWKCLDGCQKVKRGKSAVTGGCRHSTATTPYYYILGINYSE